MEVDILALRPKLRSARRLIPLAFALLLASLIAVPTSNLTLAQSPPGDEITLVNAERDAAQPTAVATRHHGKRQTR